MLSKSCSKVVDKGYVSTFVCEVYFGGFIAWWRHQMEPFSALLALCAGNSPITGEFPTQRPVMRSFDIFFNLRLNKRLSKQSWGWWFETPSPSLWRHCNGLSTTKCWACSEPKTCILWQSPVPPNDGKVGITITLSYHCETFPFQLFLLRIRLHVFSRHIFEHGFYLTFNTVQTDSIPYCTQTIFTGYSINSLTD